jgi:sortase A
MALMDKKRYEGKRHQSRRSRKRIYRKRRRTGFFVFVGLVVLTIGALIYLRMSPTSEEGVETVERVEDPSVVEAPEEPATEEAAEEEEEAAPPPPDEPTMYLTIPKLGIYNALVIDDVSETLGLELGAGHLPGTGFPWIPGSNTYIAGHRIGYPGTGSDHIFFNLHLLGRGDEIFLTDANGTGYKYRVSESLQIDPSDVWVTEPVAGRDVVSLQTCIENFGDFATLGPNWNVRFIIRADKVAQA